MFGLLVIFGQIWGEPVEPQLTVVISTTALRDGGKQGLERGLLGELARVFCHRHNGRTEQRLEESFSTLIVEIALACKLLDERPNERLRLRV